MENSYIVLKKEYISKVNRAICMLKQVLGHWPCLCLMNKSPILVYGCSLWGIPDSNRHIESSVKKQVETLLFNILHRPMIID